MKKLNLLLCIGVILFSLFASAEFKVSVSKNSDCDSSGELFIAQGKKLIYQIPIFQNNHSTVYINKGDYKVSAITKDCEFEKNITISDDKKITEIVVTLQPLSKKREPASAMSPERAYTFGLESQLRLVPGSLNYPMHYWYPWAQQQYSNVNMPCIWNIFGCNSMWYPQRSSYYPPFSNGPIVMGKPNIYVEGPDAKQLKLSFLKKSENRFMASTPSITGNFWEFDLKNNSIFKNDSPLNYLFFDARTPQRADYNLDHAFCGEKDELLKFMVEQITKRQFPKAAITDFVSHWAFKLPDMASCVFPQIEKNIESFFPVELTHQKKKVSVNYNRIYFVMVPKIASPNELPLKFKLSPHKWSEQFREPAAVKDYKIYEWGVGFLAH